MDFAGLKTEMMIVGISVLGHGLANWSIPVRKPLANTEVHGIYDDSLCHREILALFLVIIEYD